LGNETKRILLVGAIGAALALGTGCTGGLDRYNQDIPDPGTDDTAAGTDTGTATDTDTQEPDTAWMNVCHPLDPMDTAGWQRTYSVQYVGQTGTETQQGLGGGSYHSELAAGTNTWSMDVDQGCDSQGRAVQLGWQGKNSVTSSGIFPQTKTYDVVATTDVPRPYLEDLATMRAGGSWSYTYNLHLKATQINADGTTGPFPKQGDVPSSGQYVAWGRQPVTVGGVTYNAYYVNNQYTQDWTAMGNGFGNVDGYSELWYVEGLGLVKEITTDLADPSSVYISKELIAYTGLTPQ